MPFLILLGPILISHPCTPGRFEPNVISFIALHAVGKLDHSTKRIFGRKSSVCYSLLSRSLPPKSTWLHRKVVAKSLLKWYSKSKLNRQEWSRSKWLNLVVFIYVLLWQEVCPESIPISTDSLIFVDSTLDSPS